VDVAVAGGTAVRNQGACAKRRVEFEFKPEKNRFTKVFTSGRFCESAEKWGQNPIRSNLRLLVIPKNKIRLSNWIEKTVIIISITTVHM
jgi:hypothetical protein